MGNFLKGNSTHNLNTINWSKICLNYHRKLWILNVFKYQILMTHEKNILIICLLFVFISKASNIHHLIFVGFLSHYFIGQAGGGGTVCPVFVVIMTLMEKVTNFHFRNNINLTKRLGLVLILTKALVVPENAIHLAMFGECRTIVCLIRKFSC